MSDEYKIKVFASDDKLKSLGELLSNENARKIMCALINDEMYTQEISTKLDIRVSLVIFHLKKMKELGLIEITEKNIIKKGNKHRFFKINSDVYITMNKTKKEVEETGLLKRIFRDGVKLGVIGITTLIATQSLQSFKSMPPPNLYYEEPMIEIPVDLFLSVFSAIIAVSVTGIIIFLKKKKD